MKTHPRLAVHNADHVIFDGQGTSHGEYTRLLFHLRQLSHTIFMCQHTYNKQGNFKEPEDYNNKQKILSNRNVRITICWLIAQVTDLKFLFGDIWDR